MHAANRPTVVDLAKKLGHVEKKGTRYENKESEGPAGQISFMCGRNQGGWME